MCLITKVLSTYRRSSTNGSCGIAVALRGVVAPEISWIFVLDPLLVCWGLPVPPKVADFFIPEEDPLGVRLPVFSRGVLCADGTGEAAFDPAFVPLFFIHAGIKPGFSLLEEGVSTRGELFAEPVGFCAEEPGFKALFFFHAGKNSFSSLFGGEVSLRGVLFADVVGVFAFDLFFIQAGINDTASFFSSLFAAASSSII